MIMWLLKKTYVQFRPLDKGHFVKDLILILKEIGQSTGKN